MEMYSSRFVDATEYESRKEELRPRTFFAMYDWEGNMP